MVLLHGFGRTAMSMAVLARGLRRAGYTTFSPTYRSRRALAQIAADLEPAINDFAARCDGPLHLVTHSLGGLVAQAVMVRRSTAPISRVVMLAPPNGGSEIADLLFRWRLGKVVFGAIGSSLRTAPRPTGEAPSGDLAAQIGIIAGTRSLDPILSQLVLRQPNDGKVSVAATRLPGMADHITLPLTHTLMVASPRAQQQVIAFLARGRFATARDALKSASTAADDGAQGALL